jgi:hypothetical protein
MILIFSLPFIGLESFPHRKIQDIPRTSYPNPNKQPRKKYNFQILNTIDLPCLLPFLILIKSRQGHNPRRMGAGHPESSAFRNSPLTCARILIDILFFAVITSLSRRDKFK